jgi:ribonucleoside-diphosphate reductase beta chain
VSESATQRTERADFQATSDPAVLESADRGEVHLLSYEQLYNLWERQQWATQDIDFMQDRIDWDERIPPEERRQRMYGLSSFFIGEQKVADELGPIMRAAPTGERRVFLCTQIADQARHVRFFNRFYDEVGVLEADTLRGRLAETSEHVNPEFDELFDEMLKSRRRGLTAWQGTPARARAGFRPRTGSAERGRSHRRAARACGRHPSTAALARTARDRPRGREAAQTRPPRR